MRNGCKKVENPFRYERKKGVIYFHEDEEQTCKVCGMTLSRAGRVIDLQRGEDFYLCWNTDYDCYNSWRVPAERVQGTYPHRVVFWKKIKDTLGPPQILFPWKYNEMYRGLSGCPDKWERVDIYSRECWASERWLNEYIIQPEERELAEERQAFSESEEE